MTARKVIIISNRNDKILKKDLKYRYSKVNTPQIECQSGVKFVIFRLSARTFLPLL